MTEARSERDISSDEIWYSIQAILDLLAEKQNILSYVLTLVKPEQIVDEELRNLWGIAVEKQRIHRINPPGYKSFDELINALRDVRVYLSYFRR